MSKHAGAWASSHWQKSEAVEILQQDHWDPLFLGFYFSMLLAGFNKSSVSKCITESG